MSHFRSVFRLISTSGSSQVSDYGPRNLPFRYFSPRDIPGLSGWWDASDNAYITSSRGTVTNWSNKGSAGGDITAGNRGAMTIVSDYRNGKQAIYFSTASSTSYFGTSVNEEDLDGVATKCWFLVFQSNPLMPPDSEANANDLPSLVIDRYLGIVLSEGTKYPGTDIARWYFDGSDTGFSNFLSSSNVSGRNPVSGSNFILNVIANTHTAYENELTMSVNGGNDDTYFSTAYMRTGATWPYYIGSPSSLGYGKGRNRYWYEILFYTGTLTSSERTQVINYLNDKWAIY